MDVSSRIKAIVNVIEYKKLADIGTDHGYIPIYSLLSGRVEQAIGCDVNCGPLKRAQANCRTYGLEDCFQLRLANGLGGVQPGEADCIVAAGMGGRLMESIFENGRETALEAKQWVLQPQSEISSVRRMVYRMGFGIAHEEMIEEDGLYYIILNCKPEQDRPYSDLEYRLGRRLMENKGPVFHKYMEKETAGMEAILKNMEKSKDRADSLLRREEWAQKYAENREVMKWLWQ